MPTEKARFGGLDRWLLGVGALGVLVRLLYLVEGSADPSLAHPILDCYIHDGMARDLLAGANPWPEAFSRAPLYPYLMAAVYYLTGASLTAMRCLQAVVGGLTCIITAVLGRRLFSRRVGLAGGVVVALYGPMVFYDQRLLASTLVVCSYLTVLLLAVRAGQVRGYRNWLCCGVALGVAALVRPTIAPFLLVVLLGRLGLGVIRRGDRSRHLMAVGVLLAGVVVPIAPVTVRNYVKSGRFVPIAYLGGINLYIGNNPEAERTIATRPGWGWKAMRHLPHAQGQVSTKAAQDYFVDRVREYAVAQPGDFLAGMARKAALLCSSREIPRVLDPYLHREYSVVLGVLYWRLGSFCFPFGVLAPLALLGMWVTWRRPAVGLALGYLAAAAAAVVLFFVTARYRLPLVPVMAILAVSAGWWLRTQFVDRRYRHLAAGVAVLLVAGVGVNWPQAAPSDGVSFASEFHSGLAQRLVWEGDPEAAELAQRQSLVPAGAPAERHAGLALLLLDSGRMVEATSQARRAVQLAPDQPEARLTLGEILRRDGRIAEAAAELRRGLELEPYHPEIHVTLARTLAADGDYAAAVEHFRRAVHYLHDVPDWYLDYADALLHLRRHAEAVAVLEQGAERTASAAVINELAWLLATCPDPSVRNPGASAAQVRHLIELAAEPNARFLETLAAALAAAGDFQSADRTVGQAAAIARAAGQDQLADALERQRRAYERGTPWTDPIRPPGSTAGSGSR